MADSPNSLKQGIMYSSAFILNQVALFGYHISSPISLVIFSVFDTEICEIFHQKWGSAHSRGFGIKENCSIRWFYFFFLDNTSLFEGP